MDNYVSTSQTITLMGHPKSRNLIISAYWLILLTMLLFVTSCSTKKSPPATSAQIQINNQNGAAGDRIASFSKSLLGSNYRYGGNSPSTGFDCSGLVLYSYKQALGVKLPRTAHEQANAAGYKGKDFDNLVVGDLVVFNHFQHIGIYIGDGQFIHAPSTKGKVRIENLSLPYWSNNYTGGYSYFINN